MTPPLFRKEAMERLSSPDQLDQLLTVTTTRGWLALVALAVVLAAALLWGIFGSVSTRVAGEGLILVRQGVFSVCAQSAGRVGTVPVKEGDRVAAGTVVATLYSDAVEKKVEELASRLELRRRQQSRDLAADRALLQAFAQLVQSQKQSLEADLGGASEAYNAFLKSAREQHATLRQRAANETTKGEWLAKKLANQEELYRDNLITLQTLHGTRQAILDTQTEARRLGDESGKLTLQEEEKRRSLDERRREAATETRRLDDELRQRKAALDETARRAEGETQTLEAALEREKNSRHSLTRLTAPRPGTIVKLEVKSGAIVSPGERMVLLEEARGASPRGGESVRDVVVYVAAGEGKRLRPGMEVHVIPATVKAEEYGVLLGTVSSVSAFPVSSHAMMSVLENPELVQSLLKNGPLFEVWLDLQEDPASPSGFRWSSRRGPPLSLQAGTPAVANIVVGRHTPLSLVLPLFRDALFGREGAR